MILEIGQRWIYRDSNYTWVVEVTTLGSAPLGKVIQIIRDNWLERDGHTSYPIGSPCGMSGATSDDNRYYQYLEGQDRPKGGDHD